MVRSDSQEPNPLSLSTKKEVLFLALSSFSLLRSLSLFFFSLSPRLGELRKREMRTTVDTTLVELISTVKTFHYLFNLVLVRMINFLLNKKRKFKFYRDRN